MTEKMAAVYQRGRWLVSNVSDVRIIWNITTDTAVKRCTQALIDCGATGCFIDIE
jgi:hypothetical protein